MLGETLIIRTIDGSPPEGLILKPGRTFVGNAVALDLEHDERLDIANQIHGITVAEQNNMEIVSEEEILTSMNQGKTVLKLGENNEVLGFAQLSEDDLDFRRIVVRTLLGIRHPEYKNGSGGWALENAAELALTSLKFPGAREVFTRVKGDNYSPQRLVTGMGGELISEIPSPKTGRQVKIYDVTQLGLRRKKI